MEQKKESPICIRGVLVPADWDKKGNIIKVAVMTPDEEEYLVEGTTIIEDLLGLVGREVEVRGPTREEAGQKTILVQSCEPIGCAPSSAKTQPDH